MELRLRWETRKILMSVERDFPWLQAEEQQQRGPFVSPDPSSCPTGTSPACPWLPLGWGGGSSGGKKHLQHLGDAWTHQMGSGKYPQSFSWHFTSSGWEWHCPDPSSRVGELWNRVEVLWCSSAFILAGILLLDHRRSWIQHF